MIKLLIKQQYNYTLILGNCGGFTMDKLRIKNILLELCKIPSISETNGELLMAQKLYEIFCSFRYRNITLVVKKS